MCFMAVYNKNLHHWHVYSSVPRVNRGNTPESWHIFGQIFHFMTCFFNLSTEDLDILKGIIYVDGTNFTKIEQQFYKHVSLT